MVSEGVLPRRGPSTRILELAKHKTSKTVWATTPCASLRWGDQSPLWPVSSSKPGTFPSARIQQLSQHKRDWSARDESRRTNVSVFRTSQRPSSNTTQYDSVVRLSTPRTRTWTRTGTRAHSCQEPRPPHSDGNVDGRVKSYVISSRLLRLSEPKRNHPDFQSNAEFVFPPVSWPAPGGSGPSQRLGRLSLPRLRQRSSATCCDLGRPEEPVWTVSRGARKATASCRVETLAKPKQLSKDYVPPQEALWSRKYNS